MEESKTYMKTFTGKKMNPLEPKTADIELLDIAHALSMICRGNGQTTHFYSVGQHCLNCEKEAEARGCDVRVRLAVLLHDASEAYMCDLIRPIKNHMPEYRNMEERLLEVIYIAFGLGKLTTEEAAMVKTIDDDLLQYDLTELLLEPVPLDGYHFIKKPDIDFCDFYTTETAYIQKAKELVALLTE